MDAIRHTTRGTLPRAAYSDPGWYRDEQEQLFARSWLFAGLATEAPAEGGYWAVEAGPCPLVVTRSGGVLRAFHNRCRHRGARLVTGRGEARLITCFYHRWCYQLDGRLRGIPSAERFPEEARSLSLAPAQVAEWNGMIFVNPDAHGAPFEAWLGAAGPRLSPWPVADLSVIDRETRLVAANWKLFLENHIDGYHLAHLHKDSITGLDHANQAWTQAGRHWLFFEPPSDTDARPDYEPRGFAPIRGASPVPRGSTVWKLFPTFAGAAGETFFAILNVVPVSPVQTRVEKIVLAAPATPMALAMAAARQVLARRPDFLEEDVRAVEAVQAAMAAPSWEEGPLASGWEDAITAFRGHVAVAMAAV
jgi:choline monooxygenase